MTTVPRPLARDRLSRAWHLYRGVGLHEVVVVVVSFLLYFLIRGAVVDREAEAIARGLRLLELERDLGMYWELEMQSWILDSYFAIKAMNWIYFWGHMPLVAIFAVWLFAWHRRSYYLVRNAFLISGAIGLLCYALWPLAPPRLIPLAGYVDTMAEYDRIGYQAQELKTFVNPYAAMPSLHFGWSMLIAGVVAWVGRRNPFLVILGVVWPIAMLFAVVVTGNHFILDAVAGAAVCGVGLVLAVWIERLRPRAALWTKERLRAGGAPETS